MVKAENKKGKKIQLDPLIRFKEFSDKLKSFTIIDLSTDGLNNGVFNDPKKVGSGYRLINVINMYQGSEIELNKLSLLALSEKEFLKNQVKYGDIFFTRSSLVKEGIAYSNVFLNDADDVTYDGHLIRMRPNQKQFNSFYLSKILRTNFVRKQIIRRGKTATMTTIGQKDIGSVIVNLPSLPEQKKIATFLSAIDKKIQQLTRKKEALIQYKKGVMQQLFSGQLRFKDEDGKDFPEWEEKRLGDMGIFKGGGTPTTSIKKYWEGDIPWISSSDITEHNIDSIEISRHITQEALTKFATNLIPANSILFVARVGVGKLAINKLPVCTSQDFTNFTPKKDYSHFLGYYFIAKNNTLIRYAQGTSIKGFTTSDLKSIKVKLPNIKEQKKIANFLSDIDQKIKSSTTQITQTQTFKKGLLQKLFV